MLKVNGAFLTNYLSDLAFPAWSYIYLRGLHTASQKPSKIAFFGRWFGKTPVRSFMSIFLVGAVTELWSLIDPDGPFNGTFDRWDIICYYVPMFVCYLFDLKRLNSSDIRSFHHL